MRCSVCTLLGAPSAPIGSMPRSVSVFKRSSSMSFRRRMKAEAKHRQNTQPARSRTRWRCMSSAWYVESDIVIASARFSLASFAYEKLSTRSMVYWNGSSRSVGLRWKHWGAAVGAVMASNSRLSPRRCESFILVFPPLELAAGYGDFAVGPNQHIWGIHLTQVTPTSCGWAHGASASQSATIDRYGVGSTATACCTRR